MGFLKDLGSALTFGATDLIGSGLGLISNNQTNKTNMKINQMNNEFNERMMDKQIAYEQEMWQKNNEYNSASAQAQRWRDAGFNPTLMMQNGNAGVASSGSVSQATAASPVAMQSYTPQLGHIGDLMMEAEQLKLNQSLNSAQTNEMSAHADYLRAKASFEATEAYERTENWRIKNKWADQIEALTVDQLNADIEQKKTQAGVNRSIETLNLYQRLLNIKELDTFDERFKTDIAWKLSDIGLKVAQKDLTARQAEKVIEETLETFARTSGIKLNNNIIRRTTEAVVDEAYNSEYWSRYNPNLSNVFSMGEQLFINK